jgi:hypothetical protein
MPYTRDERNRSDIDRRAKSHIDGIQSDVVWSYPHDSFLDKDIFIANYVTFSHNVHRVIVATFTIVSIFCPEYLCSAV